MSMQSVDAVNAEGGAPRRSPSDFLASPSRSRWSEAAEPEPAPFWAEIGRADLDQFEAMLSSTERLIEDMTTMCNLRGYGLDDEVGAADGDIDGKVDGDDGAKRKLNAERDDVDEALTANMAVFGQFAAEQLVRYDFHLSSNDIVDLMGVEPRRSMEERSRSLQTHEHGASALSSAECTLSAHGFVLVEGKRLSPHYLFNVLDDERRRRLDVAFAKLIEAELSGPALRMEVAEYPSSAELQGITPTLNAQFEASCKAHYKMPAPIRDRGRRSMIHGLSQRHKSAILERSQFIYTLSL